MITQQKRKKKRPPRHNYRGSEGAAGCFPQGKGNRPPPPPPNLFLTMTTCRNAKSKVRTVLGGCKLVRKASLPPLPKSFAPGAKLFPFTHFVRACRHTETPASTWFVEGRLFLNGCLPSLQRCVGAPPPSPTKKTRHSATPSLSNRRCNEHRPIQSSVGFPRPRSKNKQTNTNENTRQAGRHGGKSATMKLRHGDGVSPLFFLLPFAPLMGIP